jgi:ABC-2 type transport system permease protein
MIEKRKNIRRQIFMQLLLGIALIVSLNTIGSFFFFRFDLTSEKRYSLSPSTLELLKKLDDVVYFKVYLDGDFPSGFQRLSNETREMLNEFRAYSGNIEYEFINPSESSNKEEREALYKQLVDAGLNPTDLQVRKEDGMSRQIIFPGAIVSYKNRELPLDLLTTQLGTPPEEQLNNSVQSLEYNLTNVIRKLSVTEKPKIAYLQGQGELGGLYVNDMLASLSEYYSIEAVTINGQVSALTRRVAGADSTRFTIRNKYEALIVAKPDSAFAEKDKFIIDQFIMRGGKVLWLVDPVYAEMDSLQSQNQTIGVTNEVNLTDLFFNYGVRMSNSLVLDLNALPIPIVTGRVGDQPKTDFLPWYFFPVVTPSSDHPIVKNLNAIKFEFAGALDTVDTPGVKKTILLQSSKYSFLLDAPASISLDMLRRQADASVFNMPPQTLGVLLEGNFVSLFLNRVPPEIANAPEIGFIDKSKETRMIVLADGDLIKSQLQPGQSGPTALPAGYDRYTGQQFGNKDLILNAMNYLCNDAGILSVRSRELKLRLLDGSRIKSEELKWQLVNTIVPVAFIILFGILQFYLRRHRYTKSR